MSVYQRMLGAQLPCNVLDLLGINPLPLPAPAHEQLVNSTGRGYPDVLYKLGLSHLGRQELGLARRCLGEAVELKGDFIRARLALAAVCDLLADHRAAVVQLDAALGTLPESAQEAVGAECAGERISRGVLLCASGLCLERSGEWEAAVERYGKALEHNPDELLARYRLAAIGLAHGRLDDAVEHHKAILDQQPQEQAVRISLAHLLQLLGRHQESMWEYEKALCLEPDNWDLQVELADQLAQLGDSDQAVDHLRQLIQRQPQFPDLRLRLANVLSQRGEDEPAVAEYRSALDLHPRYLDCAIALGRHELRMGRMQSALQNFQRAIEINEQNVEGYVGLAVAMHRLGNVEQAREMFAAAERIGGNGDALLVRMGMLELQTEAAAIVDATFDVDQPSAQDPDHVMHRQWLEEQSKRYAEMLGEHPMWTDVRLRLGMLLRMLGELEQAGRELQRCTEENPGLAEAWVQLGQVRQQQNDEAGAVNAYEMAVQLRPQWADLHYRLGLAYCNQLEFALAVEHLELAAAGNRGNADFQRQLWAAIEGMRMTGPRRSAEGMSGRVLPLASRAA